MKSVSNVVTVFDGADSGRAFGLRIWMAAFATSIALTLTCLFRDLYGVAAGSVPFLLAGNLLITGAALLLTIRWTVSANADRLTSRHALAASETALHASEARLKLALQASNVGLWDWDLITNQVYFSPEWKRQIGYADDELAAEYSEWESRLHAEDRERVIEAVQAFIADPAVGYDVEFRLRHKNGSYRWIHTRGLLLVDGGKAVRMLGCHVDVTEQKLTEAALREQAQEIAMAVRAAGVGVWRWDSRTDTLTHSHTTGPISRVAPRTKEEFFALVHEGDRAMLSESIRLTIEDGRPYAAEFRAVLPDKTVRHVLVRGHRLVDDSGGLVGVRGVDLDVTEKKQLEAQILQTQKMEAIGRLTGGVAHDFNNTLTVVLGYCDLLLDRFPSDSPERADVLEIRNAGRSAAALTRQLLAFSRQQQLQPAVLDINTVVTSIEQLLRRVVGGDVTLSIGLDPDLSRVYADRGQIGQALMNLAVNARDAMPDGGTLTIETGRVTLTRDRFAPGVPPDEIRAILLKVSDTGRGMTDEVKARIFEPFFTTKEQGKGTGLGLATVFGVVNQSGGFIEVDSSVGRGTTFTIFLPETDDSVTPSSAPAPRVVARQGVESVLIVDDEPGVCMIATKALERAGYRAHAAGSADEALAISDTEPIDLLITDLGLPGVQGHQLARALVERRPSLKVLYTSGHSGTALLEQQGLAPGAPFIAKPFLPNDLVQKVREALDA